MNTFYVVLVVYLAIGLLVALRLSWHIIFKFNMPRPSEREPAVDLDEDKIHCRFDFVCPRKWEELEATDNKGERYCNHCREPVYLARSKEDLDRLAEHGKCAALILKQDENIDYLDAPAFLGRLKPTKFEVLSKNLD